MNKTKMEVGSYQILKTFLTDLKEKLRGSETEFSFIFPSCSPSVTPTIPISPEKLLELRAFLQGIYMSQTSISLSFQNLLDEYIVCFFDEFSLNYSKSVLELVSTNDVLVSFNQKYAKIKTLIYCFSLTLPLSLFTHMMEKVWRSIRDRFFLPVFKRLMRPYYYEFAYSLSEYKEWGKLFVAIHDAQKSLEGISIQKGPSGQSEIAIQGPVVFKLFNGFYLENFRLFLKGVWKYTLKPLLENVPFSLDEVFKQFQEAVERDYCQEKFPTVQKEIKEQCQEFFKANFLFQERKSSCAEYLQVVLEGRKQDGQEKIHFILGLMVPEHGQLDLVTEVAGLLWKNQKSLEDFIEVTFLFLEGLNGVSEQLVGFGKKALLVLDEGVKISENLQVRIHERILKSIQRAEEKTKEWEVSIRKPEKEDFVEIAMKGTKKLIGFCKFFEMDQVRFLGEYFAFLLKRVIFYFGEHKRTLKEVLRVERECLGEFSDKFDNEVLEESRGLLKDAEESIELSPDSGRIRAFPQCSWLMLRPKSYTTFLDPSYSAVFCDSLGFFGGVLPRDTEFLASYQIQHPHRRMRILAKLSSVTISAPIIGVQELKCDLGSLAILVVLSKAEKMTFSELKNEFYKGFVCGGAGNIDLMLQVDFDCLLRRGLICSDPGHSSISLAKGQVLPKTISALPFLEESSQLHCNGIIKSNEMEIEGNGFNSTHYKAMRKHITRAAIVKIVKQEKSVGLESLLSLVRSRLGSRFPVDFEALKIEIEDLLASGFLSKEETTGNILYDIDH